MPRLFEEPQVAAAGSLSTFTPINTLGGHIFDKLLQPAVNVCNGDGNVPTKNMRSDDQSIDRTHLQYIHNYADT